MAVKRGPSKKSRAVEGRKPKKNPLFAAKIEYVDYKDVNLLRRFQSDRAKIRARRVTGNDAQQQREVARAIKNAREMALLPYTSRVTTQRGQRSDRGDRGGRADGPPPRPTAPPPGATGDEYVDESIDEIIETDEVTGGDEE